MILSGRNLKVDEVDLGVVSHKSDTGKAMAKARSSACYTTISEDLQSGLMVF